MDTSRLTHSTERDRPKRHPVPAQRAAQPGESIAHEAAPTGFQRLMAGPAAMMTPGAILSMQRTIGNRSVQRLLDARVQRQVTRSSEAFPLAKSVTGEEELVKGARPTTSLTVRRKSVTGEEELAKGANGGCGAGCGCAHCGSGSLEGEQIVSRAVAVDVRQTAPDHLATTAPGLDLATSHQVNTLLTKPRTSAKAGAAATIALGGDYGLTFPERVDVTSSAKLNKAANTWSPKVSKLAGHYSLQSRLLPGQTEITGPGGNTTQANYCAQVTSIDQLGEGAHLWYMLKAVTDHEKQHAKHFAPAMKDAAVAITASIEAVTVPHVAKMTSKQALALLVADPAYQTAVTGAQALWLAAILVRAAGDHAAGGPTEKAERKITEPMRKKICKHAKKKKWAACAACP